MSFTMPDRSKVVAVIDDDIVTRDALRLMLSTLACEAELYASAQSFLARIGASTAMCLLVDIQLDAVSGIELVRGLAAAGLRLPVIFMTGSPDQAIERRAREAGCVAFLRKPIARHELAAALKAAGG